MVTTTTPPGVRSAPDTPVATSAEPRSALLVATDTSASADPAVIAARLLAERCAGDVEVLAVLEPPALVVGAPYPVALPPGLSEGALERMRERAEHQVRMLAGERPDWSVEAQFGQPARTIARVARERGASLVITGISRHGVIDRMLGGETAAHVAQLADRPMLAVASEMTRLPQTVLVALDLDSPPIPETPAIRALLAEASSIYFVNVRPPAGHVRDFAPATWEVTYAESLRESYERVRDSLDTGPSVFHQLVTLTGNPAREILSFASYARVDLIILGQRRRWMLQQRLGGGLPARVMRATTCSVLVLPRAPAMPRAGAAAARSSGEDPHTETITERHRWGPRLAQFSRANAGRRATVEIDDSRIGAQAQASDYPFVGIDYDHHDDRIAIMLGGRVGRGAHLTHSVAAPTSVDILVSGGRAAALRVANEDGQTLVTFPE